MNTPVIQFGTSRFLQAHADLFLSEGTPALGITVVQTSGDPTRAGRLAALAAPGGYPVRIRGRQDGHVVDDERRVTSVRRCLSMTDQYEEVRRVFIEEAEYVLSNTGDSGYAGTPEDNLSVFSPAMSFPAKLYLLLAARHAENGRPLTILPMELIADNGKVLRGLVLEIAAAKNASAGLMRYIADETIWASSLVDRIVSAPIEPAGAIAEPYALWAIERAPGLIAPTTHPAIQLVGDLREIETLKLHILNLGHTALVDMWMRRGSPDRAIVREFTALPAVEAELAEIYEKRSCRRSARLAAGRRRPPISRPPWSGLPIRFSTTSSPTSHRTTPKKSSAGSSPSSIWPVRPATRAILRGSRRSSDGAGSPERSAA